MYEQQIIEEYFLNKTPHRPDINIGIGDDAAVLTVPAGKQLVVTMDTLTAGIHFPYPPKAVATRCYMSEVAEAHQYITAPYDIGYKAAAVNLSDLAAMGATPAWMMLSLNLPEIHSQWLADFSDGFMMLLNQFNVALIGGDLNRGPLSITVEAHGLIDTGKALLRSTAKPGDLIYVSGTVGTAAYALHLLMSENCPDVVPTVLSALNRPMPRIELGKALLGIASAAMDLSDGLAADLTRLLRASQFGAIVDLAVLPVDPILTANLSTEEIYRYAFTGGDDYELCFTVPSSQADTITQLSSRLQLPLTCIGRITSMPGITLLNAGENCVKLKKSGYSHFERNDNNEL